MFFFVFSKYINKMELHPIEVSMSKVFEKTKYKLEELVDYYWVNETPISDGKNGRSYPYQFFLYNEDEQKFLKKMWDKKNDTNLNFRC